jgi:hypothetical protein
MSDERQRLLNDILERERATMESRERIYGTNGTEPLAKALAAFFPDGVTLKTPFEFARYHLFAVSLGKMNRYAASWSTSEFGDLDSIHDSGNYMRLLELEHIQAEK